jgi:transcriptional regulator with XRE-family HTH domain
MRWWAEKIRLLRLGEKLTLKEVSEKCGISSSYLSELENDRHVPGVDTLEKIFKVYGHDMAPAAPATATYKAMAWAKRNPWFSDPAHMGKTNFAYGIHRYLISKGVDHDSDAYYAKLDEMISQWDRPSLDEDCPSELDEVEEKEND